MNAVGEIIASRRTIRKFNHAKDVPLDEMKEMAHLASLCPSRMNDQPLEYVLIKDPELCEQVFANILWGTRNKVNTAFADPVFAPNSYIAMLVNRTIRDVGYEYDAGAAAQNIMLYAHSLDIESVFLHCINRVALSQLLSVPETHKVDSLIGLGYPAHTSTVVPVTNGTVYSLDAGQNILLPKRDPDSITHHNRYGAK
ncbi:MAG: nitroreductase [Candidatus Peregrinibacteria bacterium GW2011_GWC2_39_14]|nr:MAG: Nitroreductase [Candidatus Peregrinibacteria bacterium GW2011_GWA2_38_36]KKR06708.1 MAG: nitroreductase [Candidatus Peregrinibacteria bacterium GW2011_GWC2_39_14]